MGQKRTALEDIIDIERMGDNRYGIITRGGQGVPAVKKDGSPCFVKGFSNPLTPLAKYIITDTNEPGATLKEVHEEEINLLI